jgi:hypothetical protein
MTTSAQHNVMDNKEAVDGINIPDSAPDETNQTIDSAKEEGPDINSASLEHWNKPMINRYRYLAAIYSFTIMGMNDAAYGVSLDAPKRNAKTKLNFRKGLDSIREFNHYFIEVSLR